MTKTKVKTGAETYPKTVKVQSRIFLVYEPVPKELLIRVAEILEGKAKLHKVY